MFTRLRHMLVKEFIQVLRDRKMRGVVLVAPVLQLMVFGYAVNTDVRDLPMAVLDGDRSASSRDLAGRFEASGVFRLEEHAASGGETDSLMDRGRAKAVLRTDRGFESRLVSGRSAPVMLAVDGTDAVSASKMLSAAAGAVASFNRDVPRGAQAAEQPLALESRAWFNENLDSRPFYVPGVLGLVLTLMTLMLTGMAVVREREIGTMEQILVSPLRPVEFIAGKTIPFAAIGLFDASLVLLVSVFWFEVPLRGSVPLLFTCLALYILTTLGFGLLISTVSRTQQQAMIASFFFFMPAMLLSGFAFPIDAMPEPVQWLTLLNPMRHLFVILRGIFLKGIGPEVLWPQMLALALLGCATMALAVKRFRRTME